MKRKSAEHKVIPTIEIILLTVNKNKSNQMILCSVIKHKSRNTLLGNKNNTSLEWFHVYYVGAKQSLTVAIFVIE